MGHEICAKNREAKRVEEIQTEHNPVCHLRRRTHGEIRGYAQQVCD
jgi:hypothetical protein